MFKTILITGCNRGLGLGLVQNLVRDLQPPQKIIATCRNFEQAKELREIADQYDNVHILQLDLREFDKYKDFSEQVSEIVREDGLNVLVNNAAISPKFTRINFVKVNQLLDTFTTNTVAPIMLTKALSKLLQKASATNSSVSLGSQRAVVLNLSSILGSIEKNDNGGYYPYRCSKTALNMATQSMSIDLKNDGILVTSLHPGWVKTDLGGPGAPMEVDDSTKRIIGFLRNLNKNHNGGFYQWDGEKLPW